MDNRSSVLVAAGVAAMILWVASGTRHTVKVASPVDPGGLPGAPAGAVLANRLGPGQAIPPDPSLGKFTPVVATTAGAGSAPPSSPIAPSSQSNLQPLPVSASLAPSAYAVARAGRIPVVNIGGTNYVVRTPQTQQPGSATVSQIQRLNATNQRLNLIAGASNYLRPAASAPATVSKSGRSL